MCDKDFIQNALIHQRLRVRLQALRTAQVGLSAALMIAMLVGWRIRWSSIIWLSIIVSIGSIHILTTIYSALVSYRIRELERRGVACQACHHLLGPNVNVCPECGTQCR